ncbi:hypothetical protein SPO0749 [Ruegeria pomeroyi DSS-3]|uniref:Uncharacterized protein n=2 Tax=Ruegeria pomeroyi TaxID=89184 RepID=Q5LVF3_RUEPO|nr:hypothetical protein SPO0749 [Ruegeria pomeroyi DSS-3]
MRWTHGPFTSVPYSNLCRITRHTSFWRNKTMANSIKFLRTFAEWGDQVRPFERSDDVLRILQDLTNDFGQTFGAYVGGKFTSVWLHEGDAPGSKEDLDLIFVNQSDGFLDIVLRREGVPADGGFLSPSASVQVLDEIVDGLRVIVGTDEAGNKTRYEAIGGQYNAVGPAATLAVTNPARARKRRVRTSA